MQPHRFILQAFDPEYGHPAFETMFAVERLEELQALLGAAAEEDPELEMFYTLDPGDIDAINHHFGLGVRSAAGGRPLSPSGPGDREPPYLVHTGYELVLMLEGRKPFTRMDGGYYPPHRHDEEEDRFDRYVALGVLHKEVQLEPFGEPLRYQRWSDLRGIADRLLHAERRRMAHPGLEARLGSVAEIGLERSFRTPRRHAARLRGVAERLVVQRHSPQATVRWGALPVHLAVTAAELTAIDDAGHRALPPRRKPLELLGSMCGAAGQRYRSSPYARR